MKLSLFVGSITDSNIGAHAIANASNPEAALGSGVSGAIYEACGGLAFQQEVREQLEEEFEVLEPEDSRLVQRGRDCRERGPGGATTPMDTDRVISGSRIAWR